MPKVRLWQVRHGSKQTQYYMGVTSTRPSLILSSKEVNSDELTYDHADKKRILELPMVHDSQQERVRKAIGTNQISTRTGQPRVNTSKT
jgi:hypothetical protein